MPASWTFLLCDAQGNALTELTTAAGRSIAYKRNSYAEAQFTLSHDDDAAQALWDCLNLVRSGGGWPTLRCYRKSALQLGESSATYGARPAILRFNGHLAPFSEDLDETALLTPVFRSPFGRLVGEGTSRGYFLDAVYAPTAMDAGLIAKDLIDIAHQTGSTGLATDSALIELTKLRDRSYPLGQNVGEGVVNLTNVLDGFDFQEVFTEDGSTLATFQVMARQGEDMPGARFEYGPDTLNNVRGVSRTVEPPINLARVLGGNGLIGTAEDAASIATYGAWWAQETQSDVVEQATLDDKAQALLRPTPIRIIDFTPEFGLDNCPTPFEDWWLGDTVSFYGRRGAFVEDVSVRINAATIVVDNEGFESTEVPDPTTPDQEATIRSSLSVEASATA